MTPTMWQAVKGTRAALGSADRLLSVEEYPVIHQLRRRIQEVAQYASPPPELRSEFTRMKEEGDKLEEPMKSLVVLAAQVGIRAVDEPELEGDACNQNSEQAFVTGYETLNAVERIISLVGMQDDVNARQN